MKKKIAILGSTGSIGKSTLDTILVKKKLFSIEILAANKNFKKISEQIKKFKPKYFIITDYKIYKKVQKKFQKYNVKILNDYKKIIKYKKKFDITISAIPGIAGLEPTFEFIKLSKKILLANKESIICAWHLLEKQRKKFNTTIIPIDSEHFSVMKLLEKNNSQIDSIFITASGGPFLRSKKKYKNIKPKDALKHPNWSMGKKISINSATMMNKLFELIEAKKIFNQLKYKIKIIIHPQSKIHAIIKYKNGLSNLLFHEPDMRIPIANAIFNANLDISDFIRLKKNKNSFEKLEFMDITSSNFPPIKFLPILDKYSSLPIILNASNEILVDQFLMKNIKFNGIIDRLYRILRDKKFKKYAIKKTNSIQDILKIDNWARVQTLKLL